MIAAALHLLPLMAHLSRASDLSMHPAAYMIMQVAWSWLVPPLLIFPTWPHQQRLQQTGSAPSWRNSSQSPPLTKATTQQPTSPTRSPPPIHTPRTHPTPPRQG